jgi:hypothetical protein
MKSRLSKVEGRKVYFLQESMKNHETVARQDDAIYTVFVSTSNKISNIWDMVPKETEILNSFTLNL